MYQEIMRALILMALLGCHLSSIATEGAPSRPLSATADAIYSSAKPRLLQIRTLVNAASQKSSTGSGFLLSADGLAMTNYHVVSQYALEPQTYRMEYLSADNTRGNVKLLAIDVVNDLALIKLDRGGWPHFEFDPRALADQLPRGERLYSLGNPLDIGFAVLEGNYSGLVERSYNERIHLSGPMNPGMSGGPTVSSTSRIAGINVAKLSYGAEQVSFLVPAKFAAALLNQPSLPEPLTATATRAEITRQLSDWQAQLTQAFQQQGFKSANNGIYQVPESAAPWFTCWARTNADVKPKPRARTDSASCNMQNSLFIAGDLQSGNIEISHTHIQNDSLNSFQFANFLTLQRRTHYGRSIKRMTQPLCHEDLIQTSSNQPKLRVQWCAAAYREFEGLYDVTVSVVSQDRTQEAVVSAFILHGFSYENASRLTQQWLNAIRFNIPKEKP